MKFYIVDFQDLSIYSGYQPLLMTAIGHVSNGTTVLAYESDNAPLSLQNGFTKEQFLQQFTGYQVGELM